MWTWYAFILGIILTQLKLCWQWWQVKLVDQVQHTHTTCTIAAMQPKYIIKGPETHLQMNVLFADFQNGRILRSKNARDQTITLKFCQLRWGIKLFIIENKAKNEASLVEIFTPQSDMTGILRIP